MVMRTTFKSNKLREGPQDTIIFHIQVSVNGEKKINVIPMEPHSETVKPLNF